MSTADLFQRLNELTGRKKAADERLTYNKKSLKSLMVKTPFIEETQALIQTVAQDTQNQLKYHVEDIVQVALDACFPGEYSFCMDFEMKSGRTVCELYLEDEVGNKVNPMNAAGGGLVDLVSFALRLSAWTLGSTEPFIVLDEPFKYLSENLRPVAGEILQELQEKLGLQFLMVTHDPYMVDIADVVYSVKKNRKGISIVTKED